MKGQLRLPVEVERPKRPLLAALLSAVIPGAGQWYAGRRLRAWLYFAPIVVLAVATISMANRGAVDVFQLLVQPSVLRTLLVLDLVVLMWRVAAVVDAYLVAGDGTSFRWAASAVVVVLVVVVTAPHVVAGSYGVRSIELLETVFIGEVEDPGEIEVAAPPAPPVTFAPAEPSELVPDPLSSVDTRVIDVDPTRNLLFREGVGDPDAIAALPHILSPTSLLDAPFPSLEERVDPGRLTILLAGGDAGPGRSGLRTDTMMVVSIDVATGESAIFGVPRNLRMTPLPRKFQNSFIELQIKLAPEPDLTDADGDGYPDAWTDLNGDGIPDEPPFEPCQCFPDLLNAIYPRTNGWTSSYPTSPAPGMEVLTETLEYMLDIDIDYYVLVDMSGFVKLIDAFGGVEVMVTDALHVAVSAAEEGGDKGVVSVEPGLNTLSGLEALAYVRWRRGSSDYVRMVRQRCLVRSAADQADPFTVLRKFGTIADAIQNSVVTNIPLSFLPDFVEIAAKVDLDEIYTVGLVPGYYVTGYTDTSHPIPHLPRMRAKVGAVLAGDLGDVPETAVDGECGV